MNLNLNSSCLGADMEAKPGWQIFLLGYLSASHERFTNGQSHKDGPIHWLGMSSQTFDSNYFLSESFTET